MSTLLRSRYNSFQVLFFLSLLVMGCSQPNEPISESEAIETIEGLFNALGEYIEGKNTELINEYITEDFIIYEVGRKMNKKEFLQFASGFPILECNWELSDFRVSTDVNSAHASLFNKGEVLMQTDSSNIIQNYDWLESAYLVKVDGKLKVKFYFSDIILLETKKAD